MGSFYDGAARCSGRKFSPEFFTQLFEYFFAYLGLHLASHPDLGIIWNDVFLLHNLSIDDVNFALVKRDDVRSGRKAEAHHGRLWPA